MLFLSRVSYTIFTLFLLLIVIAVFLLLQNDNYKDLHKYILLNAPYSIRFSFIYSIVVFCYYKILK